MLFLYLHLSSLNLCLLITTVVVINFGLDCFINSVLVYFSYSAHTLFNNKLGLVISYLRVNVHRCFTRYLNIHVVTISPFQYMTPNI